MDDKNTREIYRRRLQEAVNRVPERIRNGSIQATREWMRRRDAAAKLANKPGATLTDLMSALQSIE